MKASPFGEGTVHEETDELLTDHVVQGGCCDLRGLVWTGRSQAAPPRWDTALEPKGQGAKKLLGEAARHPGCGSSMWGSDPCALVGLARAAHVAGLALVAETPWT